MPRRRSTDAGRHDRVQLAGGSTLFSSFKERLEREVQEVSAAPLYDRPARATPGGQRGWQWQLDLRVAVVPP